MKTMLKLYSLVDSCIYTGQKFLQRRKTTLNYIVNRKNRIGRYFFLITFFNVLTCCFLPQNGYSQANLTAKKMVWAHSMVSFPVDFKSEYAYIYKELFPLLPAESSAMLPTKLYLELAKAEGIDGLAIDIFVQASSATKYFDEADKMKGVVIAPCLDLSTTTDKENKAYSTIAEYCALAKSRPSAAMQNDSLIIFTYGTNQMAPDAWGRVRQKLKDNGYKTYWMAAAGYNGDIAVLQSFPRDEIAQYFPNFESFYIFGLPLVYWNNLVSLFQEFKKTFGGGIMPGYFRWGGGNLDPKGTSVYRKQWENHLKGNTKWACINTYNDYAENTMVTMNSDWNLTRFDLTRWYSSKFKNEVVPFKDPRLYVTSPKSIYLKDDYIVEALLINPSSSALTVTVKLVDGNGNIVVSEVTSTVLAGEIGDANIKLSISAIPELHFLKAIATIKDGTGIVISSLSGAPITVLEKEIQPGIPSLYYSISSAQVLNGNVGLVLEGKPYKGNQASINISLPINIKPRYVELLHNNLQVKNFFEDSPFSALIPPYTGWTRDNTDWGFYIARVTDIENRVGYSNPIYITPPPNMNIYEKYSFEENSGTIAIDSSNYRYSATLQKAEWSFPGVNGSKSCIYLGGPNIPSYIGMPQSKTPVTPIEISLAVSPIQFGGLIFCDAGGFTIGLEPDGKVKASRIQQPGNQWQSITSSTSLKLRQWTNVKTQWDGDNLYLFINDVLEGKIPCSNGFTSGRRALGCNVFNYTSFYTGQIDEMVIKAMDNNIQTSTHYLSNSEINIFPNPVKNILFFTGNNKDSFIEIYSILGNKLISIKATESVDVTNLKKGVYVLIIDKKHQFKFVK